MKEKKKEPVARKLTGSKRMTQVERHLNSKIRETQSQESLLLFLFAENYSKILAEPMVELVWEFMEFLKSTGYCIVNEKEVFCFPFSKLVREKGLR